MNMKYQPPINVGGVRTTAWNQMDESLKTASGGTRQKGTRWMTTSMNYVGQRDESHPKCVIVECHNLLRTARNLKLRNCFWGNYSRCIYFWRFSLWCFHTTVDCRELKSEKGKQLMREAIRIIDLKKNSPTNTLIEKLLVSVMSRSTLNKNATGSHRWPDGVN